jgi:polyisoprenoid-binding protein YceI
MTATEVPPIEVDEPAAPAPRKRRWIRWCIGAAVGVVALLAGGPYVYIHFVEGPAPGALSLSAQTTPNPAARGTITPLAGTWRIGTGSTAGYRVKETLFGQRATAVGRTKIVTGSMIIAGTRVTKASFTIDMASITSDRSARDSRFRGPIMDTADYPVATFALTRAIELAPVPSDGVVTKYAATGDLTLHGATRAVSIPLAAQRVGNTIEAQGIVTIAFADYNVDNPSVGPAHVGDRGQLEFVLKLRPSAQKETP